MRPFETLMINLVKTGWSRFFRGEHVDLHFNPMEAGSRCFGLDARDALSNDSTDGSGFSDGMSLSSP
jgi:hypothetical protein